MDLQAYAVPQPVGKVTAVAPGFDVVADLRVQLLAGDPRFRGFHAPVLGFLDHGINLPVPGVGHPHHDGAGGVRMVAVVHGPKVKGDKVPYFNGLVRRRPVRQRAAVARGHDGIERNSFRTQAAHIILKACRQFLFRHAGLDFFQQPFESSVRNLVGLPEAFQFPFVFHKAQTPQVHADHLHRFRQQFPQRPGVFIRKHIPVKAHFCMSPGQFGNRFPDTVVMVRSVFQHPAVFEFRTRLVGVTAVRNQHGHPVIRIEQAGIARKTGKVTNCIDVLDDDALKGVFFHELENPADPFHNLSYLLLR